MTKISACVRLGLFWPGVASMLLFSGCASVQVHMGMKVYLAKTPVTSMKARLGNGTAIGPGEKLPLIVTFTEPSGATLQTEGAGQGKIMWKDLQVAATVVTANQKGIVALPGDPRVSDGKVPHVVITAPSHPDLRAELDIPIRYDEKYTANFSGTKGMDGNNGLDGTDGTSGSTGSMDPNNPQAGGDGGNGSNGGNGGDGSAGGNAPPVQVRITLRAGEHPLLQVEVTAAAKQKFYLVDPQGGSLTVRADGGAGGSGGRAGRGGRGGSGGIGSPSGHDGMTGMDGHPGSDGSSGSGGLITVTYDPGVQPFLAVIHPSSQYGPKPVFKEEPVAALW
ncbi:MAG TPA: hypothetical protein VND65_12425 [Candidatus Binatia bacterium]|nr:hypothetical protein [Candidatus Binatia bacterium]